MKIKKRTFAVLSNGEKVSLYTVSNNYMSFSVMNYGCIITSIMIPDKNGKKEDIVLGYPTFEGYVQDPFYMGAFVGRVSNRISNACFKTEGKCYQLDKNNGNHCLHSGFRGFNKRIWHSEEIKRDHCCGVRFSGFSSDGDQGFPGNLTIELTYLLNTNNELTLLYRAVCDKKTPLSFTNHSYFNLCGYGSILEHKVHMHSSSYLELSSENIPTGAIKSVKDTPFDFTRLKSIGESIDETPCGYDHHFCIDSSNDKSVKACLKALDPESGRHMSVCTDMPGFQFYTGNFLGDVVGKNGDRYQKYSGFCVETQQYPDAVNRGEFPSCSLLPGDPYESVTVYSFSW